MGSITNISIDEEKRIDIGSAVPFAMNSLIHTSLVTRLYIFTGEAFLTAQGPWNSGWDWSTKAQFNLPNTPLALPGVVNPSVPFFLPNKYIEATPIASLDNIEIPTPIPSTSWRIWDIKLSYSGDNLQPVKVEMSIGLKDFDSVGVDLSLKVRYQINLLTT